MQKTFTTRLKNLPLYFNILIIAFILSLPREAQAQNVYQTVKDGKWSDATTWLNGIKPGNVITNNTTIIIDHIIDFDNVKITNGGELIINAPLTGLELEMNNGSSLTINNSTDIANLSINGGTINLNAPLTSANLSASPGSSIYTSDPNLLNVDPAVKNDLQNNGTIKNTNTTPLPVTLISFTCQSIGATNLLSWVTTQEQNSAYIALERSIDGKNFKEINRQVSTNNFSGQSSYQYQDKQPNAGVNFYRLRQTDTDGTVSYSMITSSVANPFKMYTGSQLYFNAPVTGKVGVMNLAGAVVMNQHLVQATEVSLQHLPAGIYVLVVEQAGQLYKQKIVL